MTNRTTVKEQLRQLRDEFERVNQSYYSGQTQVMTDDVWDVKFDELVD